MSKIPNQPNQPEDGPGLAPARSFFCHRNLSWISVWPSGWVALLLLCIGLAKAAAQPIDGDAVTVQLAKSSLLLDVHGAGRTRPWPLAIAATSYSRPTAATTGSKSPLRTRRMLTGVFLVDDQVAWAVGHQSVILKSGDGGETWAKANAENDPETAYLDILFLDAKTGFIVGSYGKFLSTSDGGKTWTEAKQDDDPHFSHIIPAPDGGLWLTGEFGTVRRSGDRARALGTAGDAVRRHVLRHAALGQGRCGGVRFARQHLSQRRRKGVETG